MRRSLGVNEGLYTMANKQEVAKFFKDHHVSNLDACGYRVFMRGSTLTTREITLTSKLREAMPMYRFVDFVEHWAFCDSISKLLRPVQWVHILEALKSVGKIEYQDIYCDKEGSGYQYSSIDGQKVYHINIFCDGHVDPYTGHGPYYQEIRSLYYQRFGRDVEMLLSPIWSTIAIQYARK